MNRSALTLLGAAALAACADLSGRGGGLSSLAVSPILDSAFVGDRLLPHRVTYVDRNGNVQPAGTITWQSSDPSVAQIDAATGAVTSLKRGLAVITAQAQGLSANALVVVSDTLDLTLLLDTIYVMPGDTITVPVVVLKQNAPPATVWYQASNPAFTIDSASGLVRAAVGPGGLFPYIVHANSLADTGAVHVLTLTDTTGGRVFFSVSGTAITHVGGPAAAINYVASSGRQAFQFRGTFIPAGSAVQQLVQITLPDSVIVADTYVIDSLSPSEDPAAVNQAPALCSPPRPWALWQAPPRGLVAYSRRGGKLGVTQIVAVTNGQAMSGRFTYLAQRVDFYTDPLGVLAIYGSFVAPLSSGRTICR